MKARYTGILYIVEHYSVLTGTSAMLGTSQGQEALSLQHGWQGIKDLSHHPACQVC